MSRVDFMFGILTSLIATILFEFRFLLIIKPTKHLIAIIQRHRPLSYQSAKLNLLGIVCTVLLCVGIFGVWTETALAPSPERVWVVHRVGSLPIGHITPQVDNTGKYILQPRKATPSTVYFLEPILR